jgi:hypothetical protein
MRDNVITHLQPCEDNCGQENKWKWRALRIEMLHSPRVILPQMSYYLSLRAHYRRLKEEILVFCEQIAIGVNPLS